MYRKNNKTQQNSFVKVNDNKIKDYNKDNNFVIKIDPNLEEKEFFKLNSTKNKQNNFLNLKEEEKVISDYKLDKLNLRIKNVFFFLEKQDHNNKIFENTLLSFKEQLNK